MLYYELDDCYPGRLYIKQFEGIFDMVDSAGDKYAVYGKPNYKAFVPMNDNFVVTKETHLHTYNTWLAQVRLR